MYPAGNHPAKVSGGGRRPIDVEILLIPQCRELDDLGLGDEIGPQVIGHSDLDGIGAQPITAGPG